MKNLLIRTRGLKCWRKFYLCNRSNGATIQYSSMHDFMLILAESDFNLNFEFQNVTLNSHFLKKCIYFYINSDNLCHFYKLLKSIWGHGSCESKIFVIQQKCRFCQSLLLVHIP